MTRTNTREYIGGEAYIFSANTPKYLRW